MTQQQSNKDHRPQIAQKTVQNAIDETVDKLFNRLDIDKGWGSWLSRHEILGMLDEEMDEVLKAVHGGSLDDIASELKDVAVGCIFAIACIRAGYLDW